MSTVVSASQASASLGGRQRVHSPQPSCRVQPCLSLACRRRCPSSNRPLQLKSSRRTQLIELSGALRSVIKGQAPAFGRSIRCASEKGKDNQGEQAIEALSLEEDAADMAERAFERAALYVGAAFLFGAGIWFFMGADAGSEFFAGYLLEQSLSVDNLFVFILVFKYFRTPLPAQKTALFWGIFGAAVLRAIMILLGVELIQIFEPLLLGFAGILLYSSYKLLTQSDGGEDDDLSDNFIVKTCRRFITVTDHYDGDKFLTITAAGARAFTPLVLVVAVIELSDVIFAVDSIPAVFGITLNPLIVYSSNLFAIISLRAFYSFIAVFMEKLRFLDKAVSLVLGFIGVKMVLDYFDFHMPTWAALLVVAGTLASGVGASLLFPGDDNDDDSTGGGGGNADEEAGGGRGGDGGSSSGSEDGEEMTERTGLLAAAAGGANGNNKLPATPVPGA